MLMLTTSPLAASVVSAAAASSVVSAASVVVSAASVVVSAAGVSVVLLPHPARVLTAIAATSRADKSFFFI